MNGQKDASGGIKTTAIPAEHHYPVTNVCLCL